MIGLRRQGYDRVENDLLVYIQELRQHVPHRISCSDGVVGGFEGGVGGAGGGGACAAAASTVGTTWVRGQ